MVAQGFGQYRANARLLSRGAEFSGPSDEYIYTFG
jgi:hypothetical protein